jgi:hypothetical protein
MTRAIASAVAAAVAFAVLAIVWQLTFPAVSIDFNSDHLLPQPILRGFHDPQKDESGESFAWTTGAAQVRLRDLDRRHPWTLRVRAYDGARPVDLAPSTLIINVDGVATGTFQMTRASADYEVTIPPQSDDPRGVVLTFLSSPTYVPGGDDVRVLGLVVRRIDLSPQKGWSFPSASIVEAAAATGAVLGVALFLLSTWRSWVVFVVAAAAGHAALVQRASASPFIYSMFALRLAVVVSLLAAAVALSVRLFRWDVSRAGLVAIAVTLVAFDVKLLLLLHPTFTLGDTGYHLHRLERVMRGEYFFTSNAPGGEFPYPIAFYLAVEALGRWTRDWIPMMRTLAAIADSIAALAVYVVVSRGWRSAATALSALVLYHVMPALFQVQATAYLTNAVGNSAAVIAIATVVCAPQRRQWTFWMPLAALFALAAFLTHVSCLVILGATLVAIVILSTLVGDADARRRARAAAAVLILAAAFAWILYYGHFSEMYTRTLLPTAQPAEQVTVVPIQRAEAHQTQWAPGWTPFEHRVFAVPGYISKYLGWATMALAVAGLIRLLQQRARDALSLATIAWVVTCAAFFVLSLISPIDVRYYLGVAPAMCVLAARALHDARERRAAIRMTAIGLYVWAVVWGVVYWFAWFSGTLPR